MPSLLRCLLTVSAFIAMIITSAKADEPIAVASFAGYESLLKDIEYLDSAATFAPLHVIFEKCISEVTNGQGLAGIHRSRPWGGLLYADGAAILFVPVNDHIAFFDMLSGAGVKVDDRDEAVSTVWLKDDPILARPFAGFLLMGKDHQRLTSFAELPTEYLGDLPDIFDVAVQVNPQRTPHFTRSTVAKAIASSILPKPLGVRAERDEYDREIRSFNTIVENCLLQILEQTREITMGWQLDHATGKAVLDVTLKGRPGSQLQEAADIFQRRQSRFAAVTEHPYLFHGGARLKIDDPQLLNVLRQLADYRESNKTNLRSPASMPNVFLDAVLESYVDVAAAGLIDFDVTVPMPDNVCFAIRFPDKHQARAAMSVMESQWSHGTDENTAQAGTVTIGQQKFRRIASHFDQLPTAEALYCLQDDILFVGAGDQPEVALRRSLPKSSSDTRHATTPASVGFTFDLQATLAQLPPKSPFGFLAQIWDHDECQVGFHMGRSNGRIRLQMRLEPGVLIGLSESLGMAMVFSGASE